MKRHLASILAVASFAWFLWSVMPAAWRGPSTDFPNYYTAALLARTHQPLRHYYDWPWFQRQMHFAGIDRQLGGYIPQTPVAMAPFVPLSFFSPLTARKIWFGFNLAFLFSALWLLARITQFTFAELWLVAFSGYFTLRSNFELGQYYVFLLALLTLAVFFMLRKREMAGGALFGAAVSLKLYGAPILLFALLSRRWRAALGMLGALLLFLACAAYSFGWSDLAYFAAQVLPRALRGETLDPWHLSNGTVATLLRRLFLAEADLNPRPFFDSPAAFFFLSTFFMLAILAFPAIAAARGAGPPSKRILAWWILSMLLVSPNTASYTWALLILPVALLLDEWPWQRRMWLLPGYFLLTLPLWPVWSWAFPKVWLTLILFVAVGYQELRAIPWKTASVAFSALAVVSAAAAALEPTPGKFPRAITEPGAIYSGSPALSPAGLVYESIGRNAWVLRRPDRTYSFEGDAFHPAVPASGGPIYFELVSGRHSAIMRFDEQTGRTDKVPFAVPDPREPVVSHDGHMLAAVSGNALFLFDGQSTRQIAASAQDPAFAPGDRDIVFATRGNPSSIRMVNLQSGLISTLIEDTHDLTTPSLSPDRRQLLFAARRGANWQIWFRDLATGAEKQITSGNCNSFTPIFRGSRQIVFASDCRRGLGLPALFRAPLE